jgi:selenocysteine lyase/cysteine desulfurase
MLLPCQSHLFDLQDDKVCYVSGSSRSPMPKSVREIGIQTLNRKARTPWNLGYDEIEESLRDAWKRLVNAPSNDYFAFVPSCSYAMSTAAKILSKHLKKDDEILILRDQYSSNVYCWQATGFKVVALSRGDGFMKRIETIMKQSDCRVKIVSLPQVQWCDGEAIDLERVGRLCRARGAHLVVDATQSLGAVPFDVQRIENLAFVAASSHKWLMGPYGVCMLYVASRFWSCDDAEPLEQHEHNRQGADGKTCLPYPYEKKFKKGARAFDSGGRPNPVLLPMALEGVNVVLKWEPRRVLFTIRSLLKPLVMMISESCNNRLRIPSSYHHFFGISCKDDVTWADRCSSYLKANGFIVPSRFGSLRVSPHVYNTPDQIKRLARLISRFEKDRSVLL